MISIQELIRLKTDKLDKSKVQLVRIHACQAGGRGFESRPDS
jgi:hypothetical protein